MDEFRGPRLEVGEKVRFANPEHFPELMDEQGVDPRRTFTVAAATPCHHSGPAVLDEYEHQDVTLREVRRFSFSNQNLVPVRDHVRV